ncbi:hypothetical protein [Cellulomonas xylanilytica]|uniref:Uncharacterized protein n=1 Tax=Cellulomonas xylanilytica TaxID=233583 RepID=A0A510V8F4_9CELL|nr:hypothetical protein [Cellulomonas xylanilytica]GEK23134.1 hypothetical protein CXY01_36540 [Cellulomonas xylanilytica]
MTGPSAVLVDGALLVLDPTAQPAATRDGIVDSLLMALHLAERATPATPGELVSAVVSTLAQLGWVLGSSSNLTTDVRAGRAPLDSAGATLGDTGVTAVDSLRTAPPDALHAWHSFGSTRPGSREALVAHAAATPSGPTLALVHLSLAPAVPVKGFPWTRLTTAATLTVHDVSLSTNPAVYTPAMLSELAAKVAGAAGEVIPLTH